MCGLNGCSNKSCVSLSCDNVLNGRIVGFSHLRALSCPQECNCSSEDWHNNPHLQPKRDVVVDTLLVLIRNAYVAKMLVLTLPQVFVSCGNNISIRIAQGMCQGFAYGKHYQAPRETIVW